MHVAIFAALLHACQPQTSQGLTMGDWMSLRAEVCGGKRGTLVDWCSGGSWQASRGGATRQPSALRLLHCCGVADTADTLHCTVQTVDKHSRNRRQLGRGQHRCLLQVCPPHAGRPHLYVMEVPLVSSSLRCLKQ